MNPKSALGRDRGSNGDAAETLSVELEETTEATPPSELPQPANTAPTRPDLGPPAPGPQSTNQPGSGLGLVISVAIAAAVFAISIYATGAPTENPLPLAQTTNALFWIVGAAATVAAGIGAIYSDRTAARAKDRERFDRSPVTTAWIIPVIATATAIILVATFHNQAMFVVGPLIAFLGNAGALLSRDLLDDADDSAQRTATTIHTVVVHSVAFLALTAIYLNKMSTPVTALLVALVTALLAVETLERSPVEEARKLTMALLAGGAVAAAAVPLMWWPTHGLTGGGVLFVVFYFTIGVIQTGVERRGWLPRDAILYGLVPLAMLVVLVITA
jgi:hypothetical protein